MNKDQEDKLVELIELQTKQLLASMYAAEKKAYEYMDKSADKHINDHDQTSAKICLWLGAAHRKKAEEYERILRLHGVRVEL